MQKFSFEPYSKYIYQILILENCLVSGVLEAPHMLRRPQTREHLLIEILIIRIILIVKNV